MKHVVRQALALMLVAGTAAQAAAQGAAVSGTVKFTGAAPANPKIDMAEEPSCQSQHAGQPVDPEVVVNGGGLGNVFVYVTSGLPAKKTPAPKTSAVIDQQGCLYHPRVLGLMAGQPLEIRNSDGVLHNIKAVPKKNRGFNISQPVKGMKTTRTFNAAEPAVPFECNVHGWMHARVFVMDNPYFAVTDEKGAFSIAGLPPGTYTLEAWHEKLGTRTATVTVPATGNATATFTFAAS
jgi:hypothetical protein